MFIFVIYGLYSIYKGIVVSSIINNLLFLKFEKYVDSVLIYEKKSFSKASIINYYNSLDEEKIETYFNKFELIEDLKKKGYSYYVEVNIPSTKTYVILFWYDVPNKKIMNEVKNEINQINKIYNYKVFIKQMVEWYI